MKNINFYKENNKKYLECHLIDVDDGLMMLVVFPNNTTMLFDCNLKEDNQNRIIEFLREHLPRKRIDIFVNSHRDDDHLRGIKKLNEKYPIMNIWDSGQSGASTDSDSYKEYMELKRQLKKNNENSVLELIPSKVPVYSNEQFSVMCLNSKKNIDNEEINDDTQDKIQHTNCVVLLIECYGKRIILPGDSDWKAWKNHIVPNFKKEISNIDLLIASHHGSRTFFTSEENENIDLEGNPDTTYINSIKIMNPLTTLISCAKKSQYEFPNSEALQYYKRYTINNQVYTTAEFGTLCTLISEDGNLTTIPAKVEDISSINCQLNCYKEGTNIKIVNNEVLPVGQSLLFKITQPYYTTSKRIKYIKWLVSNDGVFEHKDHKEIYEHTSNNHSYGRDLIYRGKHILFCTVIYEDKSSDRKVFVIRGV